MNPDVKAKWLAALRSGRFKQATGALRRNLTVDGRNLPVDYAYCCLGVLCEIAVKEGVIPPADPEGFYDEESMTLPIRVREWAGINGYNPSIPYRRDPDGKAISSLAEANDKGYSFNQIADLIEEHL
jgi:hypothetical protein